LALCAGAYDALRVLPASRRTLNNGKVAVVTYRPTGTAKTLFALRPNVFPPWDDPIRIRLGFGIDGASFQRYLTEVASTLRALAAEAGVPVAGPPPARRTAQLQPAQAGRRVQLGRPDTALSATNPGRGLAVGAMGTTGAATVGNR
jgi:hypothetical protein